MEGRAMTDAPKPYDDKYLLGQGYERVKTHPYASGELLAEKVRYERGEPDASGKRDKEFRWRHKNGAGWLSGAPGIGGALYMAESLLVSAEEKPEVFVCESEKVADKL